MKRKILTVLAILLGLAGLGVLLYPSVSNWMEQTKQRRQIAAYQEAQAGEHTNIGTIGTAIGFALMMVLDVALG